MEIKGNENINRIKADKTNVNQITMIPTISFPKKVNQNRNKKLGNSRYRIFRTGLNDRLLNMAEQTEASQKVLRLVAECGYSLTQVNGQRIFGPPLDWTGPAPGPGCEIFVGKIPRMLYEHDIYPIFNCIGKIYEIRLMMDFSGLNRGYCFIMYTKQEDAFRAVKDLDHYEIRPGRRIGVVASINYCRLYINHIPVDVQAEAVVKRIYEITGNVEKVAVYRNTNGSSHYALISYKTHRGAAIARRRLVPETSTLFPGRKINVEWANPNFYPSNVLEECGTCDDAGNIIMTKIFIPSTEPKKTSARRLSRKNGQEVPTIKDNSVADLKKLQKAVQPATQINRTKSLPSNFDQPTASSFTLAYEQQDHQATKMSDEQNQCNHKESSTHQDPNRQNSAGKNADCKKEAENILPKLYDVRNDHNHNNSINLSIPNCSESSLFTSNINPLASSFEQQNAQLSASGTRLVDQTCSPNSPTSNNQINFNPADQDISLKLQAKALFQPNNIPWQNCSPRLNNSVQSNGPTQSNCNLPNGSPHRNIPFYYNAYKSQVSTDAYPVQHFQELRNVQDINQCRLVVTNSLQKVWDIITQMPSHDSYKALLEFNRLNQKAGKLLASFDNRFSAPMGPPCYYQAPCHFVSGCPQPTEDVFKKPKVPPPGCSQERPRTPRPILNRTRVNGGHN